MEAAVYFVVYGAGAIGGVLGAALHEGGHDVAFIARGENLKVLRRDGLRIEDWQGTRQLRIPVFDDLGSARLEGRQVVIVLAVKSQHTRDALVAASSVVARNASVVCVQNGVVNENDALRWFPRVYGAVVSCYATHLLPGIVQAHSSPVYGSIDVGRYPVGIDGTAEEIARCLRGSKFDSVAVSNIMPWKWRKLLVNVGATVEALCGPGASGGTLAARAREEARATLEAAGVAVPSEAEVGARQYRETRFSIPREGGSSWQSLRRGSGSVESDFINGEVVLLGRRYNVDTPINDMLQRTCRDMVRGNIAAGSLQEADLLASLGGSRVEVSLGDESA